MTLLDQSYQSLADAAHLCPALKPGETMVWYVKSEFAKDLMMGVSFIQTRRPELVPTASTLWKTHVLVGMVASNDLEDIYSSLQGEVWSPGGEASELIGGLGLNHTSMSMGDIIQIGGQLFMCDSFGFADLAKKAGPE